MISNASIWMRQALCAESPIVRLNPGEALICQTDPVQFSSMPPWDLTDSDPISLRIAADARLTTPDYLDDQTWELRLGGGEPRALAIETTFGLRARSMRIFPGFRSRETTLIDPADFHSPPVVRALLSNYLELEMQPSRDLEVTAEYWAVESHALAGRMTLRNAGPEPIQTTMLLHALLRPGEDPQSMSSLSHQGVIVLQGATGGLAPLVFLAGSATAAIAPYPALQVKPLLATGAAESYVWVHAACHELQESFQLARELAGRAWDAELARMERVNAGLLELETGDPDWDVAISMGQRQAIAAFVGPTRNLPHASPVLARSPDDGFSPHPDGRDYELSWEGFTAIHAYSLLAHLLPTAPELAKGMLLNFLAIQSPDGFIDSRPGLGGQRDGTLCMPLLATIAWHIYLHTEDRDFVQRVFGRLLNFVQAWFERRQDRDQDGHPEWDHTLHSGFNDWPTFVRWGAWGQGLDIRQSETPDLASYLVRETKALAAMAQLLGHEAEGAELLERSTQLEAGMARAWSDRLSCYLPLDRDLHISPAGTVLGSGHGEFTLALARQFDPPVRVLTRVNGPQDEKHPIQVFIHGKGRTHRKRVERITQRKFQWFDGLGTATTERPYTYIDRIEIKGLSDQFEIQVMTPDFTRRDQTGLLPLWAGVPGRERAEQMVRTATQAASPFWRQFGIPAAPADDPAYESNRIAAIWMFWNQLIGQGLVDYGYLDQAADLVGRLMQACISGLQTDHATREAYLADQPAGIGERGHISGLPPLGLMLHTLGVRLINPSKVALRGRNPFPWPVTLRWRGLQIAWKDDHASVQFVDGGEVRVSGEAVQIVEQSQPAIIPRD